MSAVYPHQQLRSAREARGETLAGVAQCIGRRLDILRAIDEGRFADVPAGVYGRSAIRAYATHVRLDPDAIMAMCEPLLPALEDPITALARLRGVRSAKSPDAPPPAPRIAADPSETVPQGVPVGESSLRALAAAAVDAGIVAAAVLVALAATLIYCRTSPSALGSGAAAPFAVFGFLVAASYFVCFAGIGGQTVGERLAQVPAPPSTTPSRDLRSIGSRAWQCALREMSLIHLLGAEVGTFTANRSASGHRRESAPPTGVHAITEI